MAAAMLDPQQLIRALNLQPLPGEGGMYCVSYVSADRVPLEALPERYAREEKPFCSAIFYLLTGDPDSFSALHRLPTDEIWHFYLGDPVEMTLLLEDGTSRQVVLGQDVLSGQKLQFAAPHSAWQGTRVLPGGRFALLGTSMAPGYTSSDFEIGDRAELLAEYPHAQEHILALTRE